MDSDKPISSRRGLLALSPMAVFLLSYVVTGVIAGDFYKMPISVALLAASVWSMIIYRGHPLTDRIDLFSKAAGHTSILYMIWVFVLAGAFSALAREMGAVDAAVKLTLRFFPAGFIVPTLFIAACFISLSIGTSVGTVVALTPIAVELAEQSGGNVAFYVALIIGGAFFGDNLSIISDTTIAATRSQGCGMNEKFKANLRIVLPAALVTLAIYIAMSLNTPALAVPAESNPWLVLPYLVVIVAAIAGINVTIVLTTGILTAMVIGLSGDISLLDMTLYMGGGIDSMGELIIITLLAAGMLGVIRAMDGIAYILQLMTARINGSRGAQGVICILTGVVNLCTANNTVAIITVGEISRRISEKFGITPRKTASLLDTSSCIIQSLIPYGAQTLLATSLAGISPLAPFPYMYYPWALTVMVILSIVFRK
ncbi:MAG: Na+/H+ antiporter NhaC family protein [Muribaculaceae bacterium]|nr:Na+/H+ antiporter NhaC family protein [Muribaculaceae bacterium]